MQILKYVFIVAIFLLTVDKVVNYAHVEILKDGGYSGLFCLKQEYVQDEVFKCVKINICTGIGKPDWHDPKVPLDMNYYNGTIYSCNVPCNYDEYVTRIYGSNEHIYIFIKKTLSVINISKYVKNGEIFSANIKNINLTDPSNVTLKFDNPLFNYTNLSINKNELKCTLQVNDKVYNTKFISKVYLLYGNYNCTKRLFLGYVFLVKEHFDVEKYIETLKEEYERKLVNYEKLTEENEKMINDKKIEYEDELEILKNLNNEYQNTIFNLKKATTISIVLVVVLLIVVIALVITIVSLKRIIKSQKKLYNELKEENNDNESIPFNYSGNYLSNQLYNELKEENNEQSQFNNQSSDEFIKSSSTSASFDSGFDTQPGLRKRERLQYSDNSDYTESMPLNLDSGNDSSNNLDDLTHGVIFDIF